MSGSLCPHCNLEVPKGQFICPTCGIDIRDWNPDKLRCPICRSLYPQGTKFCLKDGSPLEPAVVDFDTEATMFLSGGKKTPLKDKEDLIPKMKFAEEPERKVPKLQRDRTGHIAPPPPPKKPPVIPIPKKSKQTEPVIGKIEIVSDTPEPPKIHTKIQALAKPPEPGEKIAPPSPPRIPPKSQPPSEVMWSSPAEKTSAPSFIDMTASQRQAHKGPYAKIKPLSEYEKLLREEEERETREKEEILDVVKQHKKIKKAAKPSFFKKLREALKVIFFE